MGQTGSGFQQKSLSGSVLNTGIDFLQLLNFLQQDNNSFKSTVANPSFVRQPIAEGNNLDQIGWDYSGLTLKLTDALVNSSNEDEGDSNLVQLYQITHQSQNEVEAPEMDNVELVQNALVVTHATKDLAPQSSGENIAAKNKRTVQQSDNAVIINKLMQLLATERSSPEELLPDLQRLLLAYQAQDQSQSRIQNQQQDVLVAATPAAVPSPTPVQDKVDLQQNTPLANITKETNATQETEITEPEIDNLEEAVQGRVKDAPVPQLPGENGKYAGKQTDNPVIVNGLLQPPADMFAAIGELTSGPIPEELLLDLQRLLSAYQAQDQSQSRIQNQQQNILVAATPAAVPSPTPVQDKVDLQQNTPSANITKETNAAQETEIMQPEIDNLEEAVQGRVKDAPVPQLPGENGKYAGKQTDNPVIVNGLLQPPADMFAAIGELTSGPIPEELPPDLQRLLLAYQAQDQSQSRNQNQSQNQNQLAAAQETKKIEAELGNLQEKTAQGRVNDVPVPQSPVENNIANSKYAGKQPYNPVLVNGLLQPPANMFAVTGEPTSGPIPDELPPDLQKILLAYQAQDQSQSQGQNQNQNQNILAAQETKNIEAELGNLQEKIAQGRVKDAPAPQSPGENNAVNNNRVIVNELQQTYQTPEQTLNTFKGQETYINADSTPNSPTPQIGGVTDRKPDDAHVKAESTLQVPGKDYNTLMHLISSYRMYNLGRMTKEEYIDTGKELAEETSHQLLVNSTSESGEAKQKQKEHNNESKMPLMKAQLLNDNGVITKNHVAYERDSNLKNPSSSLLTRIINDSFETLTGTQTGSVPKGEKGGNEYKQPINTTPFSISNDLSAATKTSNGETAPVAKTWESNVFTQLADAIRGQAGKDGQGRTHVRLQLKPDHLGEVFIQITYKDGNIVTHFQAASEHAKYIIENSLAQLKEVLSSFNLNLQNASVSVGSEMNRRGQDWNQNRQLRKQRISSPGGTGEIDQGALGQLLETPLKVMEKLNYFI